MRPAMHRQSAPLKKGEFKKNIGKLVVFMRPYYIPVLVSLVFTIVASEPFAIYLHAAGAWQNKPAGEAHEHRLSRAVWPHQPVDTSADQLKAHAFEHLGAVYGL